LYGVSGHYGALRPGLSAGGYGAGVSDDLSHQMTREAYEALEAEIHELETKGRAAMAERIKTARAWGDLKENAEYHDAKDAQAHLETKILRLQQRRRSAVIVEAQAGGERVALGSVVTVRDAESGREQTHTLVSAHESDPASGRLSVESPLAKALAGARAGDEVAFTVPRGTRRLQVLRID
jgi:transcription elongation factor GreA